MKEEIKINKKDVKIRKSWPNDFDPSTKVEKVKSNYKRSNNRKEIEDALSEAMDEMEQDRSELYDRIYGDSE